MKSYENKYDEFNPSNLSVYIRRLIFEKGFFRYFHSAFATLHFVIIYYHVDEGMSAFYTLMKFAG